MDGLESGMQEKSDDALRRADGGFQGTGRRRRGFGRHPARSLRGGARGQRCARLGLRHFDVQLIGGMALQRRADRGDEAPAKGKTLLSTLAGYLNALAGQERAHRHGQRLPGPPRQRMDGADVPLPGHERGPDPRTACSRRARYPPTSPTSPTARTTSSASTTCATTWSPAPRSRVQREPSTSPSWTRWTPSSSTRRRTPLIISGAGDAGRRARTTSSPASCRGLRGLDEDYEHGRGARRPSMPPSSGLQQGRGVCSASTTSTPTPQASWRQPPAAGAARREFLFHRDVRLRRRERRGDDRRRVHRAASW